MDLDASRAGLPVTDGIELPPTHLLHPLRPLARWIISRRFTVRTRGTWHVPEAGPVILAANHVGVVDGPLLAIFSPRPVHALTKQEMFEGKLGGFLHHSGQIPLNRFAADPSAMKACIAVLRAGRVAGVFPEGTRGAGDLARFHGGAAYLALVTGAPVVPVTMLGTREPGGSSGSLPPRGSTVDMVYGAPFRVPQSPWPRTREQVRQVTLLLREHMLDQQARAIAASGRDLPGPLPPGQRNIDDDPHTGVVEQGAS
ncbi:lysophospholipid acyltransferase family protein [Nocardioides sp. AE5]|uniref:lysophospholipid acyltransferase family protein n=1 Tax=Nocardioides sp. AE5 TaxID=2962573 RepID=UPI0028820240|nr:lysophospholipid acyltransferase family protein [Nocardioides sp. AE5]MDT0201564.1 lysophospholipid acyltransferase family protein [Nocardioides sp. AE5]